MGRMWATTMHWLRLKRGGMNQRLVEGVLNSDAYGEEEYVPWLSK
jgi:hypothetical protein